MTFSDVTWIGDIQYGQTMSVCQVVPTGGCATLSSPFYASSDDVYEQYLKVKRVRANSVLAAQLFRVRAGFGLFDNADDLRFGEA